MMMAIPALKQNTTLRYFTFFYLYVMQGIPSGFALTALTNYLLGKQVEPSVIGTFIALVGLPWTLQFVWGPFIDRFQFSVIGHRKHWVVASQFVACLASASLLLIDDPVRQLSLMGLLFFFHSIFASIQDASVDAMAISIIPANERGRTNGFMRGGFLFGIALGSALLSLVLHKWGYKSAALLQTAILFFFTLLTFIIKLDPADPLLPNFRRRLTGHQALIGNPNIRSIFKKIFTAITNQKNLRYFSIVALVYFCFSVFIRSYTYHLIHVLHWPDQTVSLLQGGWGMGLAFIAILIGGVLSDRIGALNFQLRVMWIIGSFLVGINALFFLWHYEMVSGFGLIFWNVADPLFSVGAFPLLMALCADKVEGSQFTAYMAFINLCDVLGSYITGWALGVVAAPLLGLICGLIILLLIVLLKRQPVQALAPG